MSQLLSPSSSSSSSSNNSNSNKIHAIYVALDAHQYQRAIKLASALPKSNALGQALLAHALTKTGNADHRRDALNVLADVMGESGHPELKMAKARANQAAMAMSSSSSSTTTTALSSVKEAATTTTTTTTTTATSTVVASKKGKKKSLSSSSSTTTTSTPPSPSPQQLPSARASSNDSSATTSINNDDYLISWLDHPSHCNATIGNETWVDLDISKATATKTTIVSPFPLDAYDDTLLATLAVTLGNLQLPWTAYHMYCHAAAVVLAALANSAKATKHNGIAVAPPPAATAAAAALAPVWLSKAYLAGLSVLVRMVIIQPLTTSSSTSTATTSPSTIVIKLLNHCQVLALQLARYSGHGIHSSWAAQTAIWQYQHHQQQLALLQEQQQQQQQQQQKNSSNDDDHESSSSGGSNLSIQQQQQRVKLLPRLAESILSKRLAISSSNNSNNNNASASMLLQQSFPPVHPDELGIYFDTLAIQSKHAEVIAVLDQLLLQQQEQSSSSSSSTTTLPWTSRQLLEQRGKTLQDGIQDYQGAVQVWETLLEEYPDQWSYWKHHMDCVQHLDDGNWTRTMDLAMQLKEQHQHQQQSNHEDNNHNDANNNHHHHKTTNSKYPIRALDLVPVEIAHRQCTISSDNNNNAETMDQRQQQLFQAVCHYGETYAAQAACTWPDLHDHVEYLLEKQYGANDDNSKSKDSMALAIIEWARTTFPRPVIPDQNQVVDLPLASRQLRAYMFGIQIQHQVVAKIDRNRAESTTYSSSLLSLLPDWKDMVHTWYFWNVKNEDYKTEQAQKESRLGDELILLAVQQLLWQEENPTTLFTAAVLLEWALSKSPYNANLKIQAMDVYASLHATSRCWELFRDLSIKHIQVDSCTFLILPYLLDGGLFDEVIEVCREILRLHVSTVRDTGEFTTRAMEHGTLSKAQEFWSFQRERMTNSLSALQAKGLIFDTAPLLAVPISSGKGHAVDDDAKENRLHGSLGAHHGIVGGESDLERATQMIHEIHNPFGAPSLVDLVTRGTISADPSGAFSDNRDQGILTFQLLHRRRSIPSKKEIVVSTFRRGHVHALLIRAVLVVDATKGPKKGKLVKRSAQLETRCTSLLHAVDSASQFLERWENEEDARQRPGDSQLLKCLLLICRVLVATSAGLPDAPAQETMDHRERRVTEMLQQLLNKMTEAKTCLGQTESRSLASCCRSLVDVIVSLFAVFKMASTILNVFGWGKRKYKSRPSAAAMAKVAAVFSDILTQLRSSLDVSLSQQVELATSLLSELEQTGIILEFNMANDTAGRIAQSHRISRRRVSPILDGMIQELATYQPADD